MRSGLFRLIKLHASVPFPTNIPLPFQTEQNRTEQSKILQPPNPPTPQNLHIAPQNPPTPPSAPQHLRPPHSPQLPNPQHKTPVHDTPGAKTLGFHSAVSARVQARGVLERGAEVRFERAEAAVAGFVEGG